MELARFQRKFREVDDLVLHLKGRVLVRALLQERGASEAELRRRCAVRQTQIDRKPRAVAARLRRQRQQVLPVSLRDPEIVRAKHLQRKSPP